MLIKQFLGKFANKENTRNPTLEDAKDLLAKDGYVLGYQVKSGKPYFVSPHDFRGASLVIGASGSGKGAFMDWLGFQQISKGGGFLYSSEYHDEALLDSLAQMCKSVGRLDDLVIINADKPASSNAYNPVIYGAPDEIASRILGAFLPHNASGNAGADYYRDVAFQGLTAIVGALQVVGESFGPKDLALLLLEPKKIIDLHENLPTGSDASKALGFFADRFKTCNTNGKTTIDKESFKVAFSGIAGRLFIFAERFSEFFSAKSQPVDFRDIVMKNKIVYAPMPSMVKNSESLWFTEMLQYDLLDAICEISETLHRTSPPFLLLTRNLYGRFPYTARRNLSAVVALDSVARLIQEGRADCFDEIENAIFFHGNESSPILEKEPGPSFERKKLGKGEFYIRNRRGGEHLRFPLLKTLKD